MLGEMRQMATGYGSPGPQVDMTNHWLLRIVAAIIDSLPWAIISSVVWWALAINAGAPLVKAVGGFSWAIWFFLVPIVYGLFWVVYGAVMESSASAATFGKRFMGLRVQMLDGSKPDFNKTFTRNISKILWIIFLIDVLIAVATPGPDPRQRYFDRIAGTTVVQVKQTFAPATPPPPPPPPP
jgi:uncharacterized RDD family membrane protein YckC